MRSEEYYQPSLPDPEAYPYEVEAQKVRRLQEALAPYVDLPKLRRLVSTQDDLYKALRSSHAPDEVQALLDGLGALVRPPVREQITGPAELAALLMVEMGHLEQEQLRVVCLDTKYYIQKIHLLYQGNVNSSAVRIAEVFREPVRLNSTAIIIAHNHPSTSVDPSPDDVLVTRQIVEAGKLLSIDVLDHVIVSRGNWTSLRERQLGFSV